MTFSLQSHSQMPANDIRGIDVSPDWRSPTELWLRYQVDMPAAHLFLPEPALPDRRDNLWHTTCFELFLREPGAAP